jgi:pyruvate/2-oxoglutarate/acetoin dehydrogenase E1 component
MREGSDVTVIAIGRMVPEALQAAEDASKEGSRSRWSTRARCLPLDEETLIASVKKTTRCVTAHEAVTRGGFGAELAAVDPAGRLRLPRRADRARRREVRAARLRAGDGAVGRSARADVLEAVKRTVARA